MPSRKRAKGKARKAKARESNCNLSLHKDSVCRHGCDIISKDDVCYKFVKQVEVEMNAVYDWLQLDKFFLNMYFNETVRQMKESKEYSMIWESDDEETQQKLQSLFINLGTNLLLRNRVRSSQMANVVIAFALTSSYNFDYWDALKSSQRIIRNAEDGLVRDSAKFFNKRTPCQCLKKMYLRERSATRLSACSFCSSSKDRRQMYLCAGCLYHHYCNVECQAGHWSDHKSFCKGFNPRTESRKETI